MIDRAGNWFGEVENVRLLDWRPSGGPVFAQTTETGQTQLLYWPLDGTMMRTFVFPSDFVFGSGRWSPDGRYFIYSAVDEEIDASYVYLWQPESGAPELLHADANELTFDGYVWLPDSSAVYFGLGQEKLLRYEVEEEVMLLAGEG